MVCGASPKRDAERDQLQETNNVIRTIYVLTSSRCTFEITNSICTFLRGNLIKDYRTIPLLRMHRLNLKASSTAAYVALFESLIALEVPELLACGDHKNETAQG